MFQVKPQELHNCLTPLRLGSKNVTLTGWPHCRVLSTPCVSFVNPAQFLHPATEVLTTIQATSVQFMAHMEECRRQAVGLKGIHRDLFLTGHTWVVGALMMRNRDRAVKIVESVEFKCNGAALCNAPGTGKTAVVLTYLASVPGRTLIIVPNLLLQQWQTEATRLAIAVHTWTKVGPLPAGAPAVLTTFEFLERRASQVAPQLGATLWTRVVCDDPVHVVHTPPLCTLLRELPTRFVWYVGRFKRWPTVLLDMMRLSVKVWFRRPSGPLRYVAFRPHHCMEYLMSTRSLNMQPSHRCGVLVQLMSTHAFATDLDAPTAELVHMCQAQLPHVPELQFATMPRVQQVLEQRRMLPRTLSMGTLVKEHSEQDLLHQLQHDPPACSICQEDHVERRAVLPCLHSYCMPCILQWFGKQAVCPMCRKPCTVPQLALLSNPAAAAADPSAVMPKMAALNSLLEGCGTKALVVSSSSDVLKQIAQLQQGRRRRAYKATRTGLARFRASPQPGLLLMNYQQCWDGVDVPQVDTIIVCDMPYTSFALLEQCLERVARLGRTNTVTITVLSCLADDSGRELLHRTAEVLALHPCVDLDNFHIGTLVV